MDEIERAAFFPQAVGILLKPQIRLPGGGIKVAIHDRRVYAMDHGPSYPFPGLCVAPLRGNQVKLKV
jgi:hypothetical protein